METNNILLFFVLYTLFGFFVISAPVTPPAENPASLEDVATIEARAVDADELEVVQQVCTVTGRPLHNSSPITDQLHTKGT
jgi:hypothetical protein